MVDQTAPSPGRRDTAPEASAAPAPSWSDPAVLTVLVGVSLIAAQLALRGWAVAGGWFYSDDLEFLAEATGTSLTWSFLMNPHDSQLMPGGVLVTWLVAQAGTFSWAAAAVSAMTMQLVANLSCWWALRQLFGARWEVLVLLAAYLFWPLTFTSFMWWAAALNHLPLQAAAFLALGALVQHLRTGRRRWAVATVAAVVLGLVFYVKAVLLVIPLGLLTLLYFTDWSLGPRRALGDVLRRTRLLVVLLVLTVGGYLVLYTTTVPSPLGGTGPIGYDVLADAMFRRSLAPALLGGPWSWFTPTPPFSLVATPELLATLSLGVLVLGVARVVSIRPGAWRAVALVLPYLATAYLLTARGRGPGLEDIPGLLLRYLADSTPVLVLATGLLVLALPGDRRSGTPAPPFGPVSLAARPGRLLAVAGGIVLAGSVWSSYSYATHWREFPGRTFTENVAAEVATRPLVVLDEPVAPSVAEVTEYENTLPSTLLRPLAPRLRAVDVATDPLLLDERGLPSVPLVDGGASAPPGPQEDCGYAVNDAAVPVSLLDSPGSWEWWASVSYFAGEPTALRLRLGDRSWRMPVERGGHRWFVRGSGPPGDLVLGATEGDRTVCVTSVDVGVVVPFGPA